MEKKRLSREDVAMILDDFLAGTGDKWAWDDFISLPLADKELERIRLKCGALYSEFPPVEKGHFCNEEGLDAIKGLVEQIRNHGRNKGEK